jgi:hypothetical protein
VGVWLGIDFGTTHTVAVLETPGGRPEPLLFDSSPLLSSAVYASPDGRLLTGRDGERSARIDPARFEPNPKRRIDEASILLGPTVYPLPVVIGAVLARVAGEATRVGGALPTRTVLTYPANWGHLRKEQLARAAAEAGLDPVVLVPEPVAAAAHFTDVLHHPVAAGQALAVYDFGAGTFDASVVRRQPDGSWEVAACEGLPDVGGLDLDALLVGRIGETLRAHDPGLWARLVNPTTDADRRATRTFWDDVRDAKEQLSRTSTASVHVPLFDTDTHVTREEFERAGKPLLTRTVDVIANLLTGLGPTPLAGLYLVGGSSRIPLIGTLLHQRLAIAPTVIDQPELVVALGSLRAGVPVVSAPPVPLTDTPDFAMPVSGPPTPINAAFLPPAQPPLAQPPRRSGRRRWALIAALAVVLLASGLAVQQGLRLLNDNKTGTSTQRSPGLGNATSRAGTSAGIVEQSLDIKKTVWYAGRKFTLDRARYGAGRLQVDVSVENLSAKDDDVVWNVPVYFAADGHGTPGKVAGIRTVPGGSTVKGTFDFVPGQPISELKAGVVSIGDSGTVQASVPLTDPSRATALEPKRLDHSSGQYPVGRVLYTVHHCDLRGDYPTTHVQAPKGSYLVVCGLDVKCLQEHGDSIGATDFRLKLPDGSLVTASMWQEHGTSLALYNSGQQVLDQEVGFTTRWPAPGGYTLQLLDTYAGGAGPSSGQAEIALLLS